MPKMTIMEHRLFQMKPAHTYVHPRRFAHTCTHLHARATIRTRINPSHARAHTHHVHTTYTHTYIKATMPTSARTHEQYARMNIGVVKVSVGMPLLGHVLHIPPSSLK